MNGSLFKETGRIMRLLFRQARLKIILWLVGVLGVSLAVAFIYPNIYQSAEDLAGFGATMQNPAMIAMLGPAYESLEAYNVGVAYATEMLVFTAIAVAIMNILLVSSSTRVDEEEGRLEIVRSLPVGRLSYTTASMLTILVVNAVLVLVHGFGLSAVGYDPFTWEAAFLYSLNLGFTGLFFAGVTVVSAQLAETSRGTKGIAFGVLIISYLVRAVGDALNETVSLFSPLGWTVRTEVFVNNIWWPIIALAVGSVVLIAIGFILNSRRDISQGLLPQTPGKTRASKLLKTMPGLVWRLEKTKIISWIIGIFLLAAAFGAILGDLETYFSDMEVLQAFLPNQDSASMTEQFIVLIFGIMSLFTGVPAVTMMISLKKEETDERLDNIYSRVVSRTRAMFSYYIIGLIFIVVIQVLMGAGIYATASQVMDEPLAFETFMEAALVYIPALWFMLGLATLLVGLIPKATGLIWLYLAFTFVVMYLGDVFEFPEWINNLSVFYHTPETFERAPLLIISGLAVIISIVGFIGYNKRDIKG